MTVYLLYVGEKDNNNRNGKRVGFFKLMNIVLCIAMAFLSLKVMQGADLIHSITGQQEQTIEMNVIVLKTSSYQAIDDLKGVSFGANTSDAVNVNKTETMIEDKIGDITVTGYSTNNETVAALSDQNVEALIIKAVDLESFNDIEKNFSEKVRIIEKFELKIPKVEANAAKVTKEPFHIFISGRDKTGPISTFSLSDVNMIATINPVTNQILLTNIPRDYFVDMIGIDGVEGPDKLTHSAKGGMEATIKTVENFMGIDINYYAKFNFTSFMNVVDALGGIEIDVPKYDVIGRDDGVFTTRLDHYTISPGLQTFDSKHALSFVRERYAFAEGDDIRGKNQMIMLKAIIKKCCSPAILKNLDDVVESLKSSFETNLSADDITSLINMQISDMDPWDIQSYRLKGDNSHRAMYLATVGDVTAVNELGLYVTEPSQESIDEAKSYMDQIMDNQILKIDEDKTTNNDTD